MSRRAAALGAIVAFVALTPAAAIAQEASPTLADIEDEVMCVQCGTPLNLSTAAVADRERAFIEQEIARGKTKEEIKDELVARFGPSVLALPDDDGFGLAAYLVPVSVVVAALIGVLLALRRWRRGEPGVKSAGPSVSPQDADRLEDELAALDRDA